jgi:hypothetical protein
MMYSQVIDPLQRLTLIIDEGIQLVTLSVLVFAYLYFFGRRHSVQWRNEPHLGHPDDSV